MSPGRRARGLNSELPEVGFSFFPSEEFLPCREGLKLEGRGQTERDLQISTLI